MNDRPTAHAGPLARLVGIAARRLLHFLPDAKPELEGLAIAVDPEHDEPAVALTRAADTLFDDLAASERPLGRLARACAFSPFDSDLLGLALLPALDDRAALLVQRLAGTRRLSVGQALRLLTGEGLAPRHARAAVWSSPLWRHGLLRTPDPATPAMDWPLDPGVTLLAALDDALPPTLHFAQPGPLGMAAFSDAEQGVATRIAHWLAAPDAALLHLAGPPERGAALLRHALPDALVLHATGPEMPPWRDLALLSAARAAAIAVAWSGGNELALPPDDLATPVIALAPETVFLQGGALQRPPARLVLPPPDPALLADRWRQAMPQLDEPQIAALANQSWMSAEVIAALAARSGGDPARLAAARMETAPPRSVRMANLRVPDTGWDRLVVDTVTGERLEDVIRRFRLRLPIRRQWGMAGQSRGLSVLLTGDSGVGKTLATDAIATRLGLPVMHVDLSLVVSKYIGETEKNLSELFAAAEGFSAVLFFDEADALFGKRTNVEDAHDRYANIEVNFLLQRLEAFEGVAVLASNMGQAIDEAFMRRLDVVVPMPRPGAAQRLKLWEIHLPEAKWRDPGLPLEAIARHCEMTGGEIRNAATTAAYMAADGGRKITMRDLRDAIINEFAKKGRPPPLLPIAKEGTA